MKDQLEDKLKDYRGINKKGKFYQWLDKNCANATSHDKVRHILRKIKKPIKEMINA